MEPAERYTAEEGQRFTLPVVLQDDATPITRDAPLVHTVPIRVRRAGRGPQSDQAYVATTWADGVELDPVSLDDVEAAVAEWRTSADFKALHTFAVVMETLNLFEDALGHPMGFDSSPDARLRIEPAAGLGWNAHYDPQDRALRFLFNAGPAGRRPVYTCMSRDIVAHETGHAVLDALAPSLRDALGPQSHAVHEAIADLAAFLVAARTPKIERVPRRRLASLVRIGESLGRHLGRQGPIRSLSNDKTLEPDQGEASVSPLDPHDASQVLSGTLYDWVDRLQKRGRGLDQGALALFQRIVLRALDYLPPGELGFGDFFRTVLALYQADEGGDFSEEQLLEGILEGRGIRIGERVGSGVEDLLYEDLRRQASLEHGQDRFAELLDVDNPADWAERHRDVLQIPRLAVVDSDLSSVTRLPGIGKTPPELVARVAWTLQEPNPQDLVDAGWPEHRRVTFGSTLALDLGGRPRLQVTSQDNDVLLGQRDDNLRRLVGAGRLSLAGGRGGGDMQVDHSDGVLRVRGIGRMLHIR